MLLNPYPAAFHLHHSPSSPRNGPRSVAMLRHLLLQPKTLLNLTYRSYPCMCFSNSSSSSPHPPDQDLPAAGDSPPLDNTASGGSVPPSSLSHSSNFSDVKDLLKSSSPPRRIPTDPSPPPEFSARPPSPSLREDIRKYFSEFALKSSKSASGNRPSTNSPFSFQDLLKTNVSGKTGPSAETTDPATGRDLSFDSISGSLKNFQASRENAGQARRPSFNIKAFQDGLRENRGDGDRGPQLIGTDKLPDSIFGKERRDKKGEGEEGEPKVRKTEFVKMYSYEELGQKLQKLSPEDDGEDEVIFSLSEMRERLAKLRELEEKETESKLGGLWFTDLKESLERVKEADAKKKATMQRFSLFTNLGRQGTPPSLLNPPQEHLLENFLHPDHLSSGDKLKLKLKKARDEFKMSENDCGSTRVQIAQLTTKIKHLSASLHKKDKHSQKGLHGMVQLRKKLLKYLRRTDWDSYCLVLSKLGLRDIPEKIANYKS